MNAKSTAQERTAFAGIFVLRYGLGMMLQRPRLTVSWPF
jgi:hypothetical protein